MNIVYTQINNSMIFYTFINKGKSTWTSKVLQSTRTVRRSRWMSKFMVSVL